MRERDRGGEGVRRVVYLENLRDLSAEGGFRVVGVSALGRVAARAAVAIAAGAAAFARLLFVVLHEFVHHLRQAHGVDFVLAAAAAVVAADALRNVEPVARAQLGLQHVAHGIIDLLGPRGLPRERHLRNHRGRTAERRRPEGTPVPHKCSCCSRGSPAALHYERPVIAALLGPRRRRTDSIFGPGAFGRFRGRAEARAKCQQSRHGDHFSIRLLDEAMEGGF